MGKKRRTSEVEASEADTAHLHAGRVSKRARRKARREVNLREEASSSHVAAGDGTLTRHGRADGPGMILDVTDPCQPKAISDVLAKYKQNVRDLMKSYRDLDYARLLSYTNEVGVLARPLYNRVEWKLAEHAEHAEQPQSIQSHDDENESSDEIESEEETQNSGSFVKQFETLQAELVKMKREQQRQIKDQQSLLTALQAEAMSLRQEVDMTRVQREQQRQWNKRALKEQADSFHEEIDLLTEQLQSQTDQSQDLKGLRAELAELKASLIPDEGARQLRSARTHHHAAPKPRTQKEVPKPVEEVVVHVPPPDHVIKEVNLLKSSIKSRQKQWDFFLSREGNYMYVTNLENGLKDVLRDIRQFNIRNPQGGLFAFDLVMLAATTLFHFTVMGADEQQDFYSVPLKIGAWKSIDEFGALLLRGFGWHYAEAELALAEIESQKRKLEEMMAERLPELRFDSWFQQTSAGLQKCVGR